MEEVSALVGLWLAVVSGSDDAFVAMLVPGAIRGGADSENRQRWSVDELGLPFFDKHAPAVPVSPVAHDV